MAQKTELNAIRHIVGEAAEHPPAEGYLGYLFKTYPEFSRQIEEEANLLAEAVKSERAKGAHVPGYLNELLQDRPKLKEFIGGTMEMPQPSSQLIMEGPEATERYLKMREDVMRRVVNRLSAEYHATVEQREDLLEGIGEKMEQERKGYASAAASPNVTAFNEALPPAITLAEKLYMETLVKRDVEHKSRSEIESFLVAPFAAVTDHQVNARAVIATAEILDLGRRAENDYPQTTAFINRLHDEHGKDDPFMGKISSGNLPRFRYNVLANLAARGIPDEDFAARLDAARQMDKADLEGDREFALYHRDDAQAQNRARQYHMEEQLSILRGMVEKENRAQFDGTRAEALEQQLMQSMRPQVLERVLREPMEVWRQHASASGDNAQLKLLIDKTGAEWNVKTYEVGDDIRMVFETRDTVNNAKAAREALHYVLGVETPTEHLNDGKVRVAFDTLEKNSWRLKAQPDCALAPVFNAPQELVQEAVGDTAHMHGVSEEDVKRMPADLQDSKRMLPLAKRILALAQANDLVIPPDGLTLEHDGQGLAATSSQYHIERMASLLKKAAADASDGTPLEVTPKVDLLEKKKGTHLQPARLTLSGAALTDVHFLRKLENMTRTAQLGREL